MRTIEPLNYGIIAVSGQEATSFLQGQLTCDMAEVTEHQYRLSAYCNQQGRVQAIFWVFKTPQQILLCLPCGIIPQVLTLLLKYSRFSKVLLEDSSNAWKIFSLVNAPIDFPCEGTHVIQNEKGIYANIQGKGSQILALIPSHLPPLTGNAPSSSSYWQYQNIAAGLPQIYSETIGMFTPHELNLISLNAIHLKKGCYVGQEIVSRMYYRGKPKDALYRIGLHSQQKPALGATLINKDHKIGQVIEICETTTPHYYVGLAVLLNSLAQEKTISLDNMVLTILPSL